MSVGCVYLITNSVTGKVYVGQTWSDYNKRFNQHVWKAHGKDTTCRKLYGTMRKHGTDKFFVTPLVFAFDQTTLDDIEIAMIEQYDSIQSGYNLMLGGGSGKHSPETRAKMSATRKANPDVCRTNTGNKSTPESNHKRVLNNPKAIRVIWGDDTYLSVCACAKANGIDPRTLHYQLFHAKQNRFPCRVIKD